MTDRPQRKPPSASVTALINATQRHMAYRLEMVVLPALNGAEASKDWKQVDAVVQFLRANDPDR